MKRKLLALMLALLMVLSLVPAALLPQTAEADAAPVDQKIVQGGAILHCFDWSYNEIRANLKDIAEAGYAAVQTSPVQPAKDYNGAWTDTGGNWWKLYQPLDLRVADGSETWLGSKAELTALCSEAETYGISVIVDVVANHTANITGGGYTVNGTYNVSDQVAERLQDPDGSKGLYHTSENGTNDGSRYNMTQYHLSMPDLNTGNPVVQEMVLDFLKECVDCGVDGFRFDAAKHIELPGDDGCGSDFWPTVINGVRGYAGEKDLYIYGESLSGSGSDAWVNEFITYIGLTDSQAGNAARDAVVNQNAGALAVGTYTRGNYPQDYVIWAESHDTYEDGGSTGVSSDKIIRTWAIVGARANSTALYLARPNEQMGLASSDTAWKSPVVAAVNKFKTYYDGTGEYLSYDQEAKVTMIERGIEGLFGGCVISKLDGAGAVSLTAHMMEDGYYKDEITGNLFVVKNGTLTGNVGPTGVAVVYDRIDDLPGITANPIYFIPTGWWLNDGAEFGMYLFNGDGDYTLESQYVPLEDEDRNGVYEGDVPDPEWSEHWQYVSFMRMQPSFGGFLDWSKVWNQVANLVPDPGTNCFTISAEEGTEEATGTWSYYGPITADPIYFVPTGWWLNDGARFEMHLFNNTGDTAWVTLTDADEDGIYEAALPDGEWSGVTFVRKDPESAEHTWEEGVWNQTDNLVPLAGTNCFMITAGTSDGTWVFYDGELPVDPGAGYYLVGTMTGWSVLPEYKMERTGAQTEEYSIEVPLLRTSKPFHSQFKVVYSPDGVTDQTWYPGGFNNNYGDYTGEIPLSGVYTVYFRPNYDGSGDWHDDCIYAERSKYFVTVNDADKNGTVTVDKSVAAAGETVTVTVTPNEGYVLDTLVYMCETGFNTGEFNVTEITGTTFTMPAENAAVKATFKELSTAIEGTVEWNAEDVQFKGSTAYVIANGSAQTPRFTVKNSADGSVIDPEFYDYEYKENTAAGTGYVIVTFKGDYEGTCRGVFKIYLPATETTTVDNVADGIKLTWSAVPGADGYVIYRRAWNAGATDWTQFVRWNNTTELTWLDTTVYAGTRYQYGVKAYFNKRLDPVSETYIGGNVGDNFNLGEVGPLKTTVRITTRTLSSVTSGNKQMTVAWTGSKNFTGYQIKYATDANFTKNVKAIKITDAATYSKVITGLTNGTTYYVTVRSYHEFNGMTYFGEWSNVLSTKVGKPTITTQPKSQTVTSGTSVTFKVVATGENLTYQWYYSKNNGSTWTKWSGKTAASFSVKASSVNNGCLYRCLVKNSYGSVTSSSAKLTVTGN